MKRALLIVFGILTAITLVIVGLGTWFYFSYEEEIIPEAVNAQIKSDSLVPKDVKTKMYEAAKNAPNKTQFSLALISSDSVQFYGVERRNDSIFTAENNTKAFEIGSITKVFTSTLLANAVVDGRIELEDEINEFYDFQFNKNQIITFKSLANHTSGLPKLHSNLHTILRPFDPYKDFDSNDLQEYLKEDMKLSETKDFEYSNIGAALLANAMEKVYQENYTSLLKRFIFDRYGMNHSFTDHKNLNIDLVLPTGDFGIWNFDAYAGAGAIISTTEDLATFVLANFEPSNEELKLAQEPTFSVKDNQQIGLSWHINEEGKNFWHCHNGATGGYISNLMMDVVNKKAIVLLSNLSFFEDRGNSIVLDNLSRDLLNALY
ncbi:class A beta-lactamase-related serine hydrolase [Maribacter algicola]|uniref:Class A beta-lactamase-related serine hydrolase n=1 Tax=Maribacter algicola TaxID=2498892 RepID=A0A3R8Q5E7_9FLAO|nr:serine hydrolase domain-containing protein [Maribacter algicola]RRQ49996.1 class A beta-lactamase-related serine hydrolase [Maribacter algicola]